jgi:hypothetical protein
MRPHEFKPWGILAAAGVLLANATGAPAEELRYKFEQGQKLKFSLAQDMSLAFSGEGVPDQTMNLEQVSEMLWTVLEVKEDGTARIEQTIERIKMSVAAPPSVEFQYDSASGEEPSGATAGKVMPLLTALVGAEFEMTMSPRGEILEVKVPERVTEALQKSAGAAELGEMFTEAGFKKLVQQASPAFPEGDVAPGREWSHVFELPGSSPESQKSATTRYRYIGPEEVEGKTLEAIAVEMVLDLNMAGLADQAGAEVTVKSQQSAGKMYFDRELGRVHSSAIDAAMDMEIAALGRTISAHLEQSVKVNVKPAE